MAIKKIPDIHFVTLNKLMMTPEVTPPEHKVYLGHASHIPECVMNTEDVKNWMSMKNVEWHRIKHPSINSHFWVRFFTS